MIFPKMKPYWAWVLLGLCGACSGDSSRPNASGTHPDDLDGATPSGDGDGDGADPDGGPGPLTWAVTLSADKVELCTGECTTVRASLPETDAELSYAWSAGLAGTTEVQVCPTETTVYELTLSELPGAGELSSQRSATDQLTVSVKSCDPASPVMCEVRYRYELPSDNNVLLSQKPWLSSQSSRSTLQPTSDGGVVISAAFGQRVNLGAGAVTAGSAANGLIHKYDKDCKPVWTKVMAPSLKTDVLIPLALSVDKDDNSYVTSLGGPLLNFNPLAPVSSTFATEFVIYKFSKTGEQLYRKAFVLGGGIGAGGAVTDSAADDQGQLYVAGIVHAWTNFGGGPLDLSATAYRPFLIKLNAQGNYTTQKAAPIWQMTRAKDRLVFMDGGSNGFDLLEIALGGGQPNGELKVTALSMADLTPAWANPVSPEENYFQALLGYPDGRSIGVAYHRQFESDDIQWTETNRWVVRPIAADGTRGQEVVFLEDKVTMLQNSDAGPFDRGARPWLSQSSHNAQGALALAGYYYDGWDIKPLATSLPYDDSMNMENITYGQVFVLKLDAQYKLLWARAPEWGRRPALGGIGVDQNGDVWLHGQGRVVGASGSVTTEHDMVLTKLRGTP